MEDVEARLWVTKERNWLVITLVVFLAAMTSVVCNIASNAFDLPLRHTLDVDIDLPDNSPLWIPVNLAADFVGLAFYFTPLAFGLWAARQWPGRHIPWYLVLGLVVAAMSLPLEVALGWTLFHEYREWHEIDWGWFFFLFGVTPAAMFVTGGILGDLAKMDIRWKNRFATPLQTTRRILSDREAILKIAVAVVSGIIGIAAAAAKPLIEYIFS